MKKILLAIDSIVIGGAQNIFLFCVKEYLCLGYTVVVVASKGPFSDLLKAEKIALHTVDSFSIKSIGIIRQILKEEKPDVINTYLTKVSLLFSFVNIFYRIPLCCTLLNAIIHEKMNALQRLVYPFFYYILSYLCDGVIVNSKQNKDHFIKVAKMNHYRIKVIYSGIDDKEVRSVLTRQPNNNHFTIGVIGRLSVEKGQTCLIDALTHLKGIDFRLVIVGDGPSKEQLIAQVKKNGLSDKVAFLGFRPDVLELIQDMDLIVVPSVNETFGITIVEAFAMRRLVIASTAGGIPELVDHGVTGFLFPVKDSRKLACQIEYVFNNKDSVGAILDKAYDFYANNFTSQIMAQNTLSYYNSIVAKCSNV